MSVTARSAKVLPGTPREQHDDAINRDDPANTAGAADTRDIDRRSLGAQRTFYDASGKVVGRSATDGAGTTTNYDSRGWFRQPRNPISDLPSSAVGHRAMSKKCGQERTYLDESTPQETQIISTMRHSA
jgi:hypothetical protein